MEQKRTLWIVAAAGVFLLVVVGAALLLSVNPEEGVTTFYNPVDGFNVSKAQTSVSPVSPSQEQTSVSEGVAPVQLYTSEPDTAVSSSAVSSDVNAAAPSAGITSGAPVKVENVTVITDNALVYGTGTTTTIDLNSLKSNPASAATVVPQTQPVQTAQTAPVYTQTSDSYYVPAPKKEQSTVTVKETKPVKTASAPKTQAKNTAKTAAKASSKAPAKAAAKAPSKPDTFWIQVGSYEAKKSADEARSILESNKITNEVFTYKDAKGKLFYRVRTGPYTTKSEAEYWQKRISSTNEFAKTASYIVKN